MTVRGDFYKRLVYALRYAAAFAIFGVSVAFAASLVLFLILGRNLVEAYITKDRFLFELIILASMGFVMAFFIAFFTAKKIIKTETWGKEWSPNEVSAEEFFGEELGEILAPISSMDHRISRRELKRVLRRIVEFLYNHPEKWARPGRLPLEVDFGKERGLRLSLFPEEAEGLAEEEESDELLVTVDLEGKGWWIKLFPVNEILSLRKSELMRNVFQQNLEEEQRESKE